MIHPLGSSMIFASYLQVSNVSSTETNYLGVAIRYIPAKWPPSYKLVYKPPQSMGNGATEVLYKAIEIGCISPNMALKNRPNKNGWYLQFRW